MRFLFIILSFLMISTVLGKKIDNRDHRSNYQFNCLDEVDIDIENDIIVLTCNYDRDQWIEITPEFSLFVNGRSVYLDRYQRRLVADYYNHFMNIIDQAKLIGKEGAIIGVKGAKIGIIAAAGALKMLVSDYDSDDIEEDIEEEKSELEERAERLEEMADDLEETAEDFEDLHYVMKKEIKELNNLDWF